MKDDKDIEKSSDLNDDGISDEITDIDGDGVADEITDIDGDGVPDKVSDLDALKDEQNDVISHEEYEEIISKPHYNSRMDDAMSVLKYVGNECKKNAKSSPKSEKAMGIAILVFFFGGLLAIIIGAVMKTFAIVITGFCSMMGIILLAALFKVAQGAYAKRAGRGKNAITAMGVVEYSNFSSNMSVGSARNGEKVIKRSFKVTVICGEFRLFAFSPAPYAEGEKVTIRFTPHKSSFCEIVADGEDKKD